MSPRKKSVVWDHFTKRSKTSAQCKYCDKCFLTAGNTTNLHKHLATHASEFNASSPTKETTISLVQSESDISDATSLVPSTSEEVSHEEPSHEEPSLSNIPKKSFRRPRSLVWNHFSRQSKTSVQCNYCEKTISTIGNTTSLHRHLSMHGIGVKGNSHQPEAEISDALVLINSVSKDIPNNGLTPIANSKRAVRKKKSLVWNHFTKESMTSAKCNYCDKPFATGGNTTNLHKHLFIHGVNLRDSVAEVIEIHSDNPNDFTSEAEIRHCDSQEVTIIDSSQHVVTYKHAGPKYSLITEAIKFMIAKDIQPVSVVEDEGFKFLLEVMVPHYKIPSKDNLLSALKSKYDALLEQKKALIASVDHVAFAIDIWSETCTNKFFMDVTIHYILNEEHVSHNITVEELWGALNSEAIGLKIKELLTVWDISLEKVIAVVTSNDPSTVKAVKDVFGMEKHLPCFAQALNVLAQESLVTEKAKILIEKVQAIAAFFQENPTATSNLNLTQAGTVLKVIQGNANQWNSMYLMLERYKTLHPYIVIALSKSKYAPPALNAYELDELRDMLQLLEPVYEVTFEISNEKYTSASKLIPLIFCMKIVICSKDCPTDTGKALKDIILEKLENWFSSMQKVELMAYATILDPRFKRMHFESDLICAEMVKKIDVMVQENNLRDVECYIPIVLPSLMSIWTVHDSLSSQDDKRAHHFTLELDSALKEYLSCEKIARSDSPISFWNLNKSVCPKLATIALKYLAIPGTSVPAENFFSKSGYIKSEKRKRLSEENLKELTFLNSFTCEEWLADNV